MVADRGRITEVTLGSGGEFETCPDWASTLDKRRRCARIALKTMDVCGFDQKATEPQKFETCPAWGARKIVVSILSFAGDPKSTLELVAPTPQIAILVSSSRMFSTVWSLR